MDTNKMREQFEAWAMDQGYFNLRRDIDGRYKFQTAWAAWEGWQASREAVVVELPTIWEQGSNTALGQACAQIRTADIEAIEAQGLNVEVKP